MTESLATIKDVANHLTAKGGEVMIASRYGSVVASLRARIVDFAALVDIHFRSSGVVRVSVGLPARVTDANRAAFALKLDELNRSRLGAGLLMTRSNVVFVTDVPTAPDGGVAAHQLDRAIELAIAACREALPALERLGETGRTPP